MRTFLRSQYGSDKCAVVVFFFFFADNSNLNNVKWLVGVLKRYLQLDCVCHGLNDKKKKKKMCS